MKPLIGINLDVVESPPKPKELCLQATYYEAVLAAGGIPVLLAPMNNSDLLELTSHLNGLLLTGGPDYSPGSYGQKLAATEQSKIHHIHSDREDFDLRLAKIALNNISLPVLGICGGCQLINIVCGGTLIHDIPNNCNSQCSWIARRL